jgi:bacterioferritin-associated ferredoxin
MVTACADAVLATENPIVCRCLAVREAEILSAIACPEVRTLRDVARSTGAGSGCRACHCALKEYIESRRYPICD